MPLPPPADTPLSDADGKRILDIAKMFSWSMECSCFAHSISRDVQISVIAQVIDGHEQT